MDVNWTSIQASLKGYCIEVFAVSISYLADYLLHEPEKEYDSIRLAIDLRIYYLSKNIINLLDTLVRRHLEYRHLYGAAFNLGVAAALHPASRLPQSSTSLVNQLTMESIVYTSGYSARALIEMPLEKQWIIQHLLTNRWKLFNGSVGVFCSLIPYFGISSAAFYWSGELLDTWRTKDKNEAFSAHLMTAKANIPVQVILAKFIKVCVKASNKVLPFPDFVIDAMAGIVHRLLVDLSAVYAHSISLRATQPVNTNTHAAFFQLAGAFTQPQITKPIAVIPLPI